VDSDGYKGGDRWIASPIALGFDFVYLCILNIMYMKMGGERDDFIFIPFPYIIIININTIEKYRRRGFMISCIIRKPS